MTDLRLEVSFKWHPCHHCGVWYATSEILFQHECPSALCCKRRKESVADAYAECDRLNRTNAALRGQITKLQARMRR